MRAARAGGAKKTPAPSCAPVTTRIVAICIKGKPLEYYLTAAHSRDLVCCVNRVEVKKRGRSAASKPKYCKPGPKTFRYWM